MIALSKIRFNKIYLCYKTCFTAYIYHYFDMMSTTKRTQEIII